MNVFFKLLKTEFKRIFSNNVLLAIFFGAPIGYGILFGFVYKQAKVINLPIVIIDQDQSPISDKITDALIDNEALLVKEVKTTTGNLKKEMPKEQYLAVITLPERFEADILQKRYPEIKVDLNMSNILNANIASKNIQAVLMTINAGIEIESLKKQGMHESQAVKSYEPFKIAFNKLYNSTGNYDTFMIPGLLGAIMQQVIFLAMALVFARDFEDGHFYNLVSASKWSIYHITLKSVPFLLLIPLMWILVGLIAHFFRIELIFNLATFILVTLLTLASMSIGMLFSMAIPNQLKATEFLMVISTPAFVLSGFTWPTLAMPKAISNLSQCIPLTPFLNGFKKINFYEGNLASISTEINNLLLILLIAFISMLILLQLKIARYKKKNSTLFN